MMEIGRGQRKMVEFLYGIYYTLTNNTNLLGSENR